MQNIFAKSAVAFVALAAAFGASAGSKDAPVGVLTSALDNSVWENSQWISAADAPVVTGRVDDGARAADGSSWFVSTVVNPKKVMKAVWMTAGLGVYDLYVNGLKVGREVLKPGFTHPFKTKNSFTYDVTDAVRTKAGAENQFAAEMTPGWWGDKIVTPGGNDGMYGTKTAFRGVLELTFTDGSKEYYGTGTAGWRAGIAGPIKHAAIFDGEEYDARELPGFAVAGKLGNPEVNNEFHGEIVPAPGAQVYHREDLVLQPKVVYIWEGVTGNSDDAYGKVVKTKEFKPGEELSLKPGETLVVDFGQNCAAVPRFEFSAPEGTTLTCLPGELLNDGNGAKSRGMDGPEGSVHRLNLRIPDTGFRMKYTFGKGNNFVTYNPTHTFFGYRYISVTADNDVKIKSMASVPVSSISKEMEIGEISTGNEMVNKLISNTLWGQRSNYLSVPTDCPQRNERLGWTADTQVFTETGTFFANTDGFFHKWLRDLRDTQSDYGGFPGVAPLAQYGCWGTDMFRLGWSDSGVIVPWVVWKQFGDNSIVDESWASMEKYMDRMAETKYDHNALQHQNGNYQWADWLSYEPLESCGGLAWKDGKLLPEAVDYWNYLSASYWAIDADYMADMARATGRDAAKYEKMAAEARQYLRDSFFNADGEFKTEVLNTMQTPALFALRNNLFDGEAREKMIGRLRKNFADHGNCLQTGFLGTSILMPTLTDNGMADIAYELLFQRRNPSWMYSIDNGATTIWERWNSYMKDTGMGPRGMNSFNHYAYGCVCEWMWETMAGIQADPAAPGFKHIIMKPVPDKRLGHLDATYNSAAGQIKSSWRYDGDRWTWTFTIPSGSTATVTLPGQSASATYPSGTHTLSVFL